MTTADYLNQLEQDRQDLVDNLETKGITGLTGDETFTELVPEVLNIQGGMEPSDIGIVPTSNSSISQYWPSAVNKLYLKSNPSSSVSFSGFLGDEIIFDDNFCNTGNYTIDFKNLYYLKKITNLNIKNTSSYFSFNDYFLNCPNLEEVTFGSVNITFLYDMGGMCGTNCAKLKEFDASNWNATPVSNGVNLGWAFYVVTALKRVDLSGIHGNVSTFRQAFQECRNLEEINISNIVSVTSGNMYATFYICTSLMKIDMRNLIVHTLSDYGAMFGYDATSGPPDDCLIIVKDNTEKAWINTNFSRLTNVKTVAEYEAS